MAISNPNHGYDHAASLKWMAGLFASGIVAVVSATGYLEARSAALYASRIEVTEVRNEVKIIRADYTQKLDKLESLEAKQTAMLVHLAEIRTKLDILLLNEDKDRKVQRK